MVYKTTKKAVLDGYWKIISIGYCDAQYLLRYQDRIAYTAGRDGWNADVYHFGNIAIVTGYRPFGNIHPVQDTPGLITEYDKKAAAIVCNYSLDYDVQKKRVNKLLNEFIRIAAGIEYDVL